jgi:hypothetical protein
VAGQSAVAVRAAPGGLVAEEPGDAGVLRNAAPRPRSEGFYPVVLTTALLCLGWVVVIQPELYHDFNLLGRLPFSGQP